MLKVLRKYDYLLEGIEKVTVSSGSAGLKNCIVGLVYSNWTASTQILTQGCENKEVR